MNKNYSKDKFPHFTWGGSTKLWEFEAKEISQILKKNETNIIRKSDEKKHYYLRDQN